MYLLDINFVYIITLGAGKILTVVRNPLVRGTATIPDRRKIGLEVTVIFRDIEQLEGKYQLCNASSRTIRRGFGNRHSPYLHEVQTRSNDSVHRSSTGSQSTCCRTCRCPPAFQSLDHRSLQI